MSDVSGKGAHSRPSARLWLLWVLFVIYGSTIPFQFVRDWPDVAAHVRGLTFNLLIPPGQQHMSLPDFVANVLLYLPFGFLGARSLHGRTRYAPAIVIVLGGCLSAALEVAQLFTIDRVTALSDVTANTAGVSLGLAAHAATRAIWTRQIRALRANALARVPALYPAVVAAAVAVMSVWEPFDVSLDVGPIVSKLRTLWADPFQFTGLNDEGVMFLRFALLGIAVRAWLWQRGRHTDATPLTILGTGVLAASLESSQLFIGSRMPGAEDALVMALGGAAGAILGACHVERLPRLTLTLLMLIATAASAAMQTLGPFTFAAHSRDISWFPFLNYYHWTSSQTLSHAFEMTLMYFPLGFTFMLIDGDTRRSRIAVLAAALILSASFEYLQGHIVGRYPDVTDVVLAVLGAWIGVWMASRGAQAFSRALEPARTSY